MKPLRNVDGVRAMFSLRIFGSCIFEWQDLLRLAVLLGITPLGSGKPTPKPAPNVGQRWIKQQHAEIRWRRVTC